MANDYNQKYEIDYDEIFAPVTRLETIWLIIVIVTQHRWRIYQMDVKSAFLEIEIYIE